MWTKFIRDQNGASYAERRGRNAMDLTNPLLVLLSSSLAVVICLFLKSSKLGNLDNGL